MVGTVTGVSFAVTSVFSGLVIGNLGMGWAFYLSVILTIAALVHLRRIHVEEPEPVPAADGSSSRIDVRGALESIRAVPGLMLLVLLAAFNNLLGGVFMALMDAYGLSIVSVQTWGLLFGVVSSAFIIGGLVVAKVGLGSRPARIVLAGNLVNWIVCATFTLRSSIVLLGIGMFIWLLMIPVIEAAEQTVLQRSIPFERQGRVFGFAQLVENAAAPLTAMFMGPIAERVFMPFMTDGKGADWIGGWFGTGPERGLALIFTLAGLLGIVVTIGVRLSRSYRRLNVGHRPSRPDYQRRATWRGPRTWPPDQWASSASSMVNVGIRARNVSRATRSSMRARLEPRQRWMPAPNAKWRLWARSIWNSSGSSKTAGSRLPAGNVSSTLSPACIGQPANSTSATTSRAIVTGL